jgi:hypothetical protein
LAGELIDITRGIFGMKVSRRSAEIVLVGVGGDRDKASLTARVGWCSCAEMHVPEGLVILSLRKDSFEELAESEIERLVVICTISHY